MQKDLKIFLTLSITILSVGDVKANEKHMNLLRLLSKSQCNYCNLSKADLVHAQLSNSSLEKANLAEANLSGAILDGANLKGADLRKTILYSCSLRSADLSGANLKGADFRESDLTNAKYTQKGMQSANWVGAKGVDTLKFPYHYLHNYGVKEIKNGRIEIAEYLFDSAIKKLPTSGVSHMARGVSRFKQSKYLLASADFMAASKIYKARGQNDLANKLEKASISLNEAKLGASGNDSNSFIEGIKSIVRVIGFVAFKSISPI